MLIFSGLSHAEDTPLFHANSKELGYGTIDIDISEISRGERTSMLKIHGFHGRSAFGSRWLMCAYTSLAMKRNFKNWAAYYPTQPDENLLLIFPDHENEDLSKLASQELDKARIVPSPPLNKMLAFCSQVLKK
jgi:hypothetical protein